MGDEIGDAGLRRGPLGVERFGFLGKLAARRLECDPGEIASIGRLCGEQLGASARSRAFDSSASARSARTV